MKKKIDINNEKQIFKEFNIDYCFNSEVCSRELCMLFKDICFVDANFNKKQALIDLGRIAITLNEQEQKIKELENELNQQNGIILFEGDALLCGDYYCINNDVRRIVEENKQLRERLEKMQKDKDEFFIKYQYYKDEYNKLKNKQNSKSIEVLKNVKSEIYKHCGVIGECYLDKVDFERLFKNKINELRGGEND